MELHISLNPITCMHNNTENSHYIEKPCMFCKGIIRFHFLIGYVQKAEQILKHIQINLNVAILQIIFVEELCIDRPVCHVLIYCWTFQNLEISFFRHNQFNCVILTWLNCFLLTLSTWTFMF